MAESGLWVSNIKISILLKKGWFSYIRESLKQEDNTFPWLSSLYNSIKVYVFFIVHLHLFSIVVFASIIFHDFIFLWFESSSAKLVTSTDLLNWFLFVLFLQWVQPHFLQLTFYLFLNDVDLNIDIFLIPILLASNFNHLFVPAHLYLLGS